MSRLAVRLLAAVTAIAIACTGPTDACGCSILPPAAVVTGRVIDAADAPVAGARVALDGVPVTMSAEPSFIFFGDPAVTGADGRFVTRAHARFDDGELALRAAVVRAGSTDTVRVRVGTTARFGGAGAPDTVDVTVRLP